jgi:hypothetical protein
MLSWSIDGSEYYTSYGGSTARIWLDRDIPTYLIRRGTRHYASNAQTMQEAKDRCERLLLSQDGFTTYTGKHFTPLDPRIEDISIEDIAHALSMVVRFGGHIPWPYTVAQHSVLVSYLCPKDPFRGLLHDSEEAYLGDMITSTKRQFPEYELAGSKLRDLIFTKYGLTPGITHEIEIADKIALATEFRDLRGMTIDVEPHPGTIKYMTHDEAKNLFLNRFRELYI